MKPVIYSFLVLIAAIFAIGPTTSSADPTTPIAQAPSKDIRYGRSCKACDVNIKYGRNCTIPDKKTCGPGDFEKGAGFCVARGTDSKGYCSGRCKSSADCKSGWSCQDLKTGAGGVCVR